MGRCGGDPTRRVVASPTRRAGWDIVIYRKSSAFCYHKSRPAGRGNLTAPYRVIPTLSWRPGNPRPESSTRNISPENIIHSCRLFFCY